MFTRFTYSVLELGTSLEAIRKEPVFDIYILQRLPMNFGKYLHWNEQNVYLYFAFCLLSTLLIAILFHKLTNKLDSLVFKERT